MRQGYLQCRLANVREIAISIKLTLTGSLDNASAKRPKIEYTEKLTEHTMPKRQ